LALGREEFIIDLKKNVGINLKELKAGRPFKRKLEKSMVDDDIRKDLMEKYRVAGKIRLISFFLLLFFLSLMKWIGGYEYLNTALMSLILVEAILNQPYEFIVRRVNIYRLQYYQMTVDIIAISWFLYYMGGIDAPVVGIAYYAVILWAGVTSTTRAVFFAVFASALSFSLIVILSHNGILPQVSFYDYKMPGAKMFSLLIGNISYLFAFGYFSAYSSKVIKYLERKGRDESLRYAHKFSAIDHLIGHTTHDMLGRFNNVKACANLMLEEGDDLTSDQSELLNIIVDEQGKGIVLLRRLSKFSRNQEPVFEPADINRIIEDAIELIWPVVKFSNMTIEKKFASDIPSIMAIKDQLQEVLVAMILNALDATVEKGTLTIQTNYQKEKNDVEILLSDTGVGIKEEHIKRILESFFTTKGQQKRLGLGLAISREIILRHKGNLQVKSKLNKGTTFTIRLPIAQSIKL